MTCARTQVCLTQQRHLQYPENQDLELLQLCDIHYTSDIVDLSNYHLRKIGLGQKTGFLTHSMHSRHWQYFLRSGCLQEKDSTFSFLSTVRTHQGHTASRELL